MLTDDGPTLKFGQIADKSREANKGNRKTLNILWTLDTRRRDKIHTVKEGKARIAMAMNVGEIERLIKAGIPDAEVTIQDLAGDGDHYAAHVISRAFSGLSRVK